MAGWFVHDQLFFEGAHVFLKMNQVNISLFQDSSFRNNFLLKKEKKEITI